MKRKNEDLNISENKKEGKVPRRVFPKRVSEKKYTGGYYLPKQDLHQILETLFKLKLQSQDEEGNAGYLVAKKQRHPNLFWLVDSVEARRDLRALIPLLDLLSRVQKMPDDMCDLGSFEHAMALNPKQIQPFVKKAIIEGRTYTDKDGKEKPLAQFYVERLHNGEDVYGVCVPRTAQGQKALLKLAGFKIHTCDISKLKPSWCDDWTYDGNGLDHWFSIYRVYKNGRTKMLSRNELARLYNVTGERIRQISVSVHSRLVQALEDFCMKQDKSGLKDHSSTDKDVLYIKDPDGDFIMTQTALKRGFNSGYGCPSILLSKTKQKIIKFDRESRE